MATGCTRIDEDLLGVVDGTASHELAQHVADCDDCRDAKHAATQAARLVARAGEDYVASSQLEQRVQAKATTGSTRESETRIKTASPAPSAGSAPTKKRSLFGRRPWLLAAAAFGIGAGVLAGVKLADYQKSPSAAAQRAWHGKVVKIVRGGADKTGGLTARLVSGKEVPLEEGGEIKAGWHVITDARTRARIELDDGTSLVLDRGTDVALETTPRTLSVKEGSIVADVAHVDGAPNARITAPIGAISVLGTKVAMTATADRTSVQVLRGTVEVTGDTGTAVQVAAGQEAELTRNAKVEVSPANDLAQRVAFGERLGLTPSLHNEDADAAVSGLGELRARRPGKTDEKDHAVRLTNHAAKVRIVGNVARTEIDETFTNDTADVLEGVYRFPLPPGAQIERLGLEVDGKMIEGEFVDKAKGAAIFRGAIHNSIPQAPKPREEIIWVPGPWHDPALLEWQRGGRFELKIFPIPKKGARRVIIAYTETVAPVGGVRRYVYPLPQSTASDMKIDAFSLDVQVLGNDPKSAVKARGYELAESKVGENGTKLAQSMTGFTPSGDLTIEYALADRRTDVTAWAFRDTEQAAPAVLRPKTGATPVAVAGSTDAFVALALRPKLPKWTDVKPRDQVIVVDAGRAMFGERFARAKRLAVQVTQEMDRRDRVTVLACDVTCRAMPGGFKGPGSGAAHDVDAFLAGITPDGASDLVGAVRAAGSTSGHEKERDMRVILVSDGAASAGYRRLDRVAAEVSETLVDARAEVITVPIGTDADVTMLEEVARGGGGVLVPYQPGEMLETAALDVLNATYGTTLRDVELTLPAGLHDVAPALLAPMRAGGETIVVARTSGDRVEGDIILRGKVGGEAFEARYPIDVRTTTDAGNAFVPRLFAAARIADKERDGGDASRAELVALSRRHAVPSRFTSLLVLESEAMFQAFGIDRSAHATTWTGESNAQGNEVATVASADLESLAMNAYADSPAKKDKGASEEKSAFGSLGLLGNGAGGGGSRRPGDGFGTGEGRAEESPSNSRPQSAPAPASPPPAPVAKAGPRAAATSAPLDDLLSRATNGAPRDFDRRRGGQFMKRVWFRRSSIVADSSPAFASDKVAAARAALQAAPDERGRHKELVRMLAANGQLDELGDIVSRWSLRDPLDADAIASRSDLLARQGDREGALRVLGGIAAANTGNPNDAGLVASVLAAAHERAGNPGACAFRIAAAELRPTDVDTVARAIVCERGRGHSRSADRWIASQKDGTARTAVTSAATRIEGTANAKENTSGGDVVVSATWDSGADADLDLAVLDPSGARASWISRSRSIRSSDVRSRDRETLALSNGMTGPFVIEVVRAAGSNGPVTGKLTVRALNSTQTIPFVLTSNRVQVARVDVRMESELVPADPPETTFIASAGPFDRGAASGALSTVNVSSCRRPGGPTGAGQVRVTFASSGNVIASAAVSEPFAGTAVGECVAARFRSVRVPGFTGGNVVVGKSFRIADENPF